MQVNRTLTSLDLSLNMLGLEGAAAISDMLKVAVVAGCRNKHTECR